MLRNEDWILEGGGGDYAKVSSWRRGVLLISHRSTIGERSF